MSLSVSGQDSGYMIQVPTRHVGKLHKRNPYVNLDDFKDDIDIIKLKKKKLLFPRRHCVNRKRYLELFCCRRVC